MWQKSWNGGFATETRKDEMSFGKACRRTLPGQEGQPFWRPGGAVAGTRETCPSHGCEFPENSQLNLRGTRHLDLARHIHGRWRGSGKWCLWGRAGGRWQEEGSRGPQPQWCRASVCCLFPLYGWRACGGRSLDGGGTSSAQKGHLDFCSQVKQVAKEEQKAIWEMAGLRRTLGKSILRERSRNR